MKKTLEVLNSLVDEGALRSYAIGGAMAAMFYIEAVNTEDLDIFTVLPQIQSGLIDLSPLYTALAARGYRLDHEHVIIEGIPVQFLPAYNSLVEEALDAASNRTVLDTPTRVPSAEYLCAIALQTGRPKDFERVNAFLSQGAVDLKTLRQICIKHNIPMPGSGVTPRKRPITKSSRKRSGNELKPR